MAVSLLLDNKWGYHVTYVTRGRPTTQIGGTVSTGKSLNLPVADGKWNAKDLSS
jgi:hypothetical protein